jgi:hypothetical protein
MTDEELKQLIAENAKGMKDLRKAQLQTDAQLAKTDARINKLSKTVHELSEMYGGVSSLLGDEAELDFFAALNRKPQLDNIHFDDVDFDLVRKKGNEKVQIDLFLCNKNCVAIIEVKRHLQSKHLDDLYIRIIPRFIRLFPEHKDKSLYAGMATYAIPKRAKPYVKKRIDKYGFALLTPNRDHTAINVDAQAMRAISV